MLVDPKGIGVNGNTMSVAERDRRRGLRAAGPSGGRHAANPVGAYLGAAREFPSTEID